MSKSLHSSDQSKRTYSLRHVFKLVDGTTIECARHEAQRTLDRRGSWEPPQVVWEIKSGSVWRRIWPEEIVSWKIEPR